MEDKELKKRLEKICGSFQPRPAIFSAWFSFVRGITSIHNAIPRCQKRKKLK